LGEQIIDPVSWSKGYLKDVKILGMKNEMKGSSERLPQAILGIVRCH